MPAHDSLSPQFGQSSRDTQRRERILSKSQSMLDDIDFTVDNKPYPPTEVEKSAEANNTKQWGPDPDPVSSDHPTVHRFRYGHEPEMGDDFYRTTEQEGNGHGGYLTEHTDQISGGRINMFGGTNFIPFRKSELNIDEDGPLHGVAKPVYDNAEAHDRGDIDGALLHTPSGKHVRQKDIEYMSKEEKRKLRE